MDQTLENAFQFDNRHINVIFCFICFICIFLLLELFHVFQLWGLLEIHVYGNVFTERQQRGIWLKSYNRNLDKYAMVNKMSLQKKY